MVGGGTVYRERPMPGMIGIVIGGLEGKLSQDSRMAEHKKFSGILIDPDFTAVLGC